MVDEFPKIVPSAFGPFIALCKVCVFFNDKIVDFIKSLRWKTYFFFNLSDLPTYQGKEVFNLKTLKTLPNYKLDPFENDLYKLIRKIKFSKQFNSLRTKINKDINIKNSDNIWVREDKTNNFYKIETSNYNKIIKNKNY